MLLKSYRKNIFRPECNPSFESLHCIAELGQEVGPALPYLNAVLGGHQYTIDPPSVTFRAAGKLITVHNDRIAINALKDAREADKILTWLQGEINDAWEQRDRIQPSRQAAPQPQVMEVLKLLPNLAGCGECGQATCLLFATLAVQGVLGPADCPPLAEEKQRTLAEYLGGFGLDC